MKALTLWQPYAQAIVLRLKKYETRSWATKHRGLIAIHCSVKPLSKQYRQLAEKYGITDKLQYGKVVVICDLKDCIMMTEEFIKQQNKTEIDFGDWQVGRYAWKLELVEILPEPKQTKGYQGIWNTDFFPHLEKAAGSGQLKLLFAQDLISSPVLR